MSLILHQGKFVKGTYRMAECIAKMVQVDTERYSYQEATQVSLTARHRRVRASGSQALVCPPMPCLVLGMGNTVGCPNNTSHGERGLQPKNGFFKKATSWLGYPKGQPIPLCQLHCLALVIC